MQPVSIRALVLVTAVAASPATSQVTARLAAQVRDAERAFAATMASRDLPAFAAHVADEALFFGRQLVLRGRAAVV
ncbi:MAG: DUF4440 domain-containing protein, partial [Gemmatimonadales bacterium]